MPQCFMARVAFCKLYREPIGREVMCAIEAVDMIEIGLIEKRVAPTVLNQTPYVREIFLKTYIEYTIPFNSMNVPALSRANLTLWTLTSALNHANSPSSPLPALLRSDAITATKLTP